MPITRPPVLTPGLLYRDAPAAIAWLTEAFGFEAVLVVPGARPGEVMHAELRLEGSFLMLSTGTPPKRAGEGYSDYVNIFVEDPKAAFERAVAAGATVVARLVEKDYGGAGFSVRDPEGRDWSVGSYVPGSTPA